jgi:hypothetical protein
MSKGNGWGKRAEWILWHYFDGEMTLCGQRPAILPVNLQPTVATSKRCEACDVEALKRRRSQNRDSQAIIDYLDGKGVQLRNIL